MKKRNIIIISVSLITLLFGGLVSLAIKTFPELIEEEQEKIEQSPLEDVLFDALPLNTAEEKKEEVPLTSSQGQSATYVSSYAHTSNPISHHSFKGEIAVTPTKETKISSSSLGGYIHEVEAIEVSYNHASDYYKGVSYTSSNSASSGGRVAITNKEIKQEAIHRQVESSAIMNTTLMAIGLCEVLSFILVMKRKRHLRIR